jgi:hypothetical protein
LKTLCRKLFNEVGRSGEVLNQCVFGKAEAKFSRTPETLWRIYTCIQSPKGEGGASPDGGDKGSGGAESLKKRLLPVPAFFQVSFYTNCFLFVLCFILIFILLAGLGMASPHTPARGSVAFIADRVFIIISVAFFYVLLFFAMHSGFSSVWLAHELEKSSGWPADALKSLRPPAGNRATDPISPDEDAFGHWLNARFIAAVTEPVQNIIFYPFPVLALFILSRTQIFDRFTIPPILLTVFLISFALVVLAALRLRTTSEKIRQKTLAALGDQILAAKLKGFQDLAGQLGALRDQVLELKSGAFLPFSQQPLVRAILTIVGSYSGLALLEYASVVNF